MTDENLLTLAKLREQAEGSIEGSEHLLPHGGLPVSPGATAALTFLEQCVRHDSSVDQSLEDTAAGRVLLEAATTGAATEAVRDRRGDLAAHLVGVTEQDLDADTLEVMLRISDLVENNEATAFQLVSGNPNTGKTAWAFLVTDIRRTIFEDLLDREYCVLSNVATSTTTNVVVTSMHDLMVQLLERRGVPKAVLIDEGSTHFDARTYKNEIAAQWSPSAKRFAKMGVDLCSTIGHTGKDVHPEYKRLTTLPVVKEEKTVTHLFDSWPADADEPVGEFDWSPLDGVPDTTDGYEADDAAPWNWNLRSELFSFDLDWAGLLEELRSRGPVSE